MNLKIKRLIKKYLPFPLLFKQALNFAVIFQLSAYPYLTHANPTPNTPSDKNLTEAGNINKQVESLRDHIFGERDSSADYTSHPLDFFSLLGQNIFGYEEPPSASTTPNKIKNRFNSVKKILSYKTPIELQNIIVEIVTDTSPEENTHNPEITAVLAHPGRQSLAKKILPQEQADKLSENSAFISGADEKLSFRFSFHGKVVQSFPQNIKWMVFVNNYLIFLEASKVQSEKAIISFIDLKYFESAIGKTALPIFHIPVAFNEKITAKSLLSPPHLTAQDNMKESSASAEPYSNLTNSAAADNISQPSQLLSIGEGVTLSEELLNFISHLQQLTFNTTVSLLQTENSNVNQEYLREIVKVYYESNQYQASSPEDTEISEKTKELAVKFLENRVRMGSAQNPSGVHGQLNKLAVSLPSNNSIADEFKENLKEDNNFQKELSKTHSQIIGQRKLLTRFSALFNYLTRPQPLGAPQITKALGLIANSVSLKGDTVENRLTAFKELLKQAVYPRGKQILLRTGLLAGAGILGTAALAEFNVSVLSSAQRLLTNFAEIIGVTFQSSSAWVSPSAVYSTYIEGDSLSHFLTGLAALFGITLISIGIPHLLVNSFNVGKNINRQHEVKVQSSWTRFKFNFINLMREWRSDFFKDLSNAQRKKIGIDIYISGIQYTFQTIHNLSAFESAVKDLSRPLTLTLHAGQDKNTDSFEFESSNQVNQYPLKENQISLKINGVERVFISSNEINLSDLASNAAQLELSGDSLYISGELQNTEISDEDNKKINDVLNEIEKNRSSSKKSEGNNLSQQEITTFKQAFVEFLFGYSSWAKTFRFLGLSWNWFFLSRHIATSPSSLLRIAYYSKYFKVVTQGHSPSLFNGGHQNRLSRVITLAQTRFQFKQLKQFEEQFISIEKRVLEEVTLEAYLALMEQANLNNYPQASSFSLNVKGEDIKNPKLRLFFHTFKERLYNASMREYLYHEIMGADAHSPNKASDHKLKISALMKFIEDPKSLQDADNEKIQQIVQRNKQKIKQESKELTDSFIKGFLQMRAMAGAEKSKNNLDPKKSRQMKRSEISRVSLNDPEAVARVTRALTTYFMIDKPIELIYKFLFFLGVDQGILQVLHEQAFTEEAWFHLSRYAIWAGFFGNLIVEILGLPWYKTQMDSRLLLNSNVVDSLPDKAEAEKGFLRWLWKKFQDEDNSWWKNQKFAIEIAYANLFPALIIFAIIHSLTLGRFDLEVVIATYLIFFTTPFPGLQYKLENLSEKSMGFAFKEPIRKGLDVKRLISALRLQEYGMKESSKLRRQFNLGLALLYNNITENTLEIFQNTHTALGSRALVRTFMPFTDSLPTEHWVNFINFLERNGLPSGAAETCKSIFANNRTDINIK